MCIRDRGWAYRENDKISSVELKIDQQIITDIKIGLNSKYLRESLLNVPGSESAVFARVISEEQLKNKGCLLYTSPSPRDRTRSRMPSSA